ncbi:MAG: hypothetical protein QXJ02_06495, partial [Candidatus Bathyarchaeia archaeon]
MAYAGKGDVTTAERLLKDAGFTVSETCCSRPSCFDFAARKGQSLIFVKVISDLDRLSVGDLVELK